MGEIGTAKLIDFAPYIKATSVNLPSNIALVITNSAASVPKALTSGTRFNKRVVECRFGVAAMAIKAGKSPSFNECKYTTFEALQTDLGYNFDQMLELLDKSLTKDDYTIKRMQDELGCQDPFDICQDVVDVNEVKEQNTSYFIWNRASHIIKEAKRVYEFKDICDKGNFTEDTRVQLGNFMNES